MNGPAFDRGRAWYGWHASPDHGSQPRRIVLVPCGAVEQHGPHLPVGTDAWIAAAVAAQVAAARHRVLVGEPLAYGCSGHHRAFPGTVALRVSTFVDLVADVATCLARDGDVPVFVNGHGGNRSPLSAALQGLSDEGIEAWALSYFELIEDEVAAALPDHHGCVGHACALETSLVWHLWPDAVHADRIPGPAAGGAWPDPFLYSRDRVVRHRRFETLDPSGVVGDPSRADPALGARLFQAAVERVGEVVDRIARSEPATPPRASP
ncbi:MAG: mycofactocin biosynthesis peptidyl-dipeptidase MftE [Streptosporangiales bacterium]|nr:mycofactocin biosynthesis peptidyl-dipeptidase MftE [Streptosporangiales bacterium]